MDLGALGRFVVVLGLVLVAVGAVLILAGRLPLPGNVTYRRGGFVFFAPVGLMLLLSVVVTVVLNVLLRIGR